MRVRMRRRPRLPFRGLFAGGGRPAGKLRKGRITGSPPLQVHTARESLCKVLCQPLLLCFALLLPLCIFARRSLPSYYSPQGDPGTVARIPLQGEFQREAAAAVAGARFSVGEGWRGLNRTGQGQRRQPASSLLDIDDKHISHTQQHLSSLHTHT